MCTAQLAFNGVGPLPMAAIKRARADLEGAADKGVIEHQRRLEELCAASQVLPQSACAAHRELSPGCAQHVALADWPVCPTCPDVASALGKVICESGSLQRQAIIFLSVLSRNGGLLCSSTLA